MASSNLVQPCAVEQLHRTVTSSRAVILLVAIQEIVEPSGKSVEISRVELAIGTHAGVSRFALLVLSPPPGVLSVHPPV